MNGLTVRQRFIAIFKYPLLIPHYFVYRYVVSKRLKYLIDEDISIINTKKKWSHGLFYYLAFFPSFRNLFYV